MPEWHSIQFVWPRLLWLLASLPLWLGLYVAWQRRGVQRAWPTASMNTGATNMRFTRHAPALLVLLGLLIGGSCAWVVTVPGQWLRGAVVDHGPLLAALAGLGGVALVAVRVALALSLRGSTSGMLRSE